MAVAGLPPCASCKVPADASRLVAESTKRADAWGKPISPWFRTACSACLAVTESLWSPEWDLIQAKEVASGSAIARLREALRRAGENDTLRREVGRLLSDNAQSWAAGVPELFPEIRPGIGKLHRLRTNLELDAPDVDRPAAFGPPIPPTEPWGGSISMKTQKTAITGDGPGGVIRYREGFIVLVGIRVTVVGVRNGALVVQLPEWAGLAIGAPRVQVAWGSTAREEEV